MLATKVEKPEATALMTFVTENQIKSIRTEEDSKRYYPHSTLAASLIGFTNYEGNGQYGIESKYDEILAGKDGAVISAKDASGNEMPYRYSKLYEAEDGDSIYLTIDYTLQNILEKNIEEMVKTHKIANRACGIIMNAKTGAIYAMSTAPSFDLNNPAVIPEDSVFSEISDEPVMNYINQLSGDAQKTALVKAREVQWRNKAITETYTPGSVFKVITSSAALEEKVISLTEQFSCTGSYNGIGCWKRLGGHGAQTFQKAIANSCNPAFMQIGQRIGIETFGYYIDAFGLRSKTGIDLPSEVGGIVIDSKKMTNVDLLATSFGQSSKITPLEMINAYAAIINGGNLLTPYIVSKVIDSDGNVTQVTEPEIKRQVISEETSKIMRDVLEYTATYNGAYVKGQRVGGKSGTSEKIGEIHSDRYVASYACFAPADDPGVIMLIMADEPTAGEYYGSTVTVPYARAVMEEILPYLGYYAEYSDEELQKLNKIVPILEEKSVKAAKETLEGMELVPEIVGTGETVVKQVPDSNKEIPAGGKVILYTDFNSDIQKATVPNVIGKNLSQANSMLTAAGLNYVCVGIPPERAGAEITAQSYGEGESVLKGTIVELTFVTRDPTG